MDFAIGLVNSVFNLPDRQVMFYEEFEQKNKTFLGLVEMTSGLVNASFSLPEWQAVKMIFFAPCIDMFLLSQSSRNNKFSTLILRMVSKSLKLFLNRFSFPA